MDLVWLPYGSTRPLGTRPSPPSRPPVDSLRPAVAIPGVLGLALAGIVVWGLSVADHPAVVEAAVPSTPAVATEALPDMLPESVRAWSADIVRWSAATDIPPDLIAVVMTIESCGDPLARSRAGAQGLFQVMPFHFQDGENPLDPETNATRGLAYLARGLALAGGDVGLALAGYNGGHGQIGRDPATWPTETVRYVRWGTGILGDLRAGLAYSPTLDAWLEAGGARLCDRAAASNTPDSPGA